MEKGMPHENELTPWQRFLETARYAQQHSPYYQKVLKAISFDETFDSSQLSQLPFTTKDDISQDNQAFLAVPMQHVAEYVTTSGTSGEPITAPETTKRVK
jgi:phenylacetate-CoA ligase